MANDTGKDFGELHPIKVTSKVWYLVGIDLIDAYKVTSSGNRYVLTTTDYFTKYVKVVLCQSRMSQQRALPIPYTKCFVDVDHQCTSTMIEGESL